MVDKNLIPENIDYIRKFQNYVEAMYKVGGTYNDVLLTFLDCRDAFLPREISSYDGSKKEKVIYDWLKDNGNDEFYNRVFSKFEEILKKEFEELLKRAEKRYQEAYFAVSKLFTLADLEKTLKPE